MSIVDAYVQNGLVWVTVNTLPFNTTSTAVRQALRDVVAKVQRAERAILQCSSQTFIAALIGFGIVLALALLRMLFVIPMGFVGKLGFLYERSGNVFVNKAGMARELYAVFTEFQKRSSALSRLMTPLP